MADQCIVCLENLDSAVPITADPETSVPRLDNDEPGSLFEAESATDMHNGQHIAIIKACGHILHDTCLDEWSQKANSCPICRKSFNLVQIYDKIGGTFLSDREVQDKIQEVQFDLSTYADEIFAEEDTFCLICGSAGEEEQLIFCDGCDGVNHTYCTGLVAIPDGSWFCAECEEVGTAGVSRAAEARRTSRRTPQRNPRHIYRSAHDRTLAQARRSSRRHPPDAWQGAWSQISARVWDALNIDLEYLDGDTSLTDYRNLQRRTDQQRQEFQRWQRRANIANRNGTGEMFQVMTRPIRESREPARPYVPPREEQRAWEAFDKAREENNSTTERTNGRKRKATASPREQPSEPERKPKRPRTRRVVDKPGSPSTRPASSPPARSLTSHDIARPETDASAPRASFLSDLLSEVEKGVSVVDDNVQATAALAASPSADVSSPAASPTTTGCSTPRALSTTPPPRSSSPYSLTSRVEPIYSPAEYSPNRDSRSRSDNSSLELRHPQPYRRLPHSPPRSKDSSPTRANMSMEAKAGIRGIVKKALDPHYKKPAGITKEQYAEINKLVSRMLYDKIPNPESIEEDESVRTIWEGIAHKEVQEAVKGLSS